MKLLKLSKIQLVIALCIFAIMLLFTQALKSLMLDHSLHNVTVKGPFILLMLLLSLFIARFINWRK